VVVFDIEEVSKRTREALRQKLKELGFGMLQKSVWITPHDIGKDLREFILSQGLGDEVFVMEVSCLLAGEVKALVERVWQLGKLNREYGEILEEVLALKRIDERLSDRLKKSQAKFAKIRLEKR
jgi:phenylacetic acid degradation operon negative regulatory protein